MQTIVTPITANGKELANYILIPETILEKFVGLRNKKLLQNEAMLWHFKFTQPQLFDTFGCLHPIGYIALDKNKKVIDIGVMQPYRTKFITCSYWIEFLPEAIDGVKVGDILSMEKS